MKIKTPIKEQLNTHFLGIVTSSLSVVNVPVISAYELGKLIYLRCNLQQDPNSKENYALVLGALLELSLLERVGTTNAFLLFGRHAASPAEIACCLDPFAYVSHLSAMEHHGLTDRFPALLYLTRPAATEWRNQAKSRMQKDFGENLETYEWSGLPLLTRPALSKIGNTTIHLQERTHLGAFRNVSGSALRVATIGRVFLDMLREPKFCGGIQHVLDIYRREAKRNFKLIVDEIERHGKPIDKVRAGFVLTKVCGLDSPLIKVWESFAQRGGSRKLDPDAEFATSYSETWKLSINVPSLTSADAEYDDS